MDNTTPVVTLAVLPTAVESVELQIDGNNGVNNEFSVPSGKKCHVTAKYRRVPGTDDSWRMILMNFRDIEENPDKFCFGLALGNTGQEKKRNDGRVGWECFDNDGRLGRSRTFPVKTGRYEVVLCWQKSAESVAEYVHNQEAPLSAVIPFHRFYVEIMPSAAK